MHTRYPDRYPYFLESAAHGRFDILFALPGASLVLTADGRLEAPFSGVGDDDFFAALDFWWRGESCDASTTGAVPFAGGWFVYLGYELAAQVEPRLSLHRYAELPTAFATRVRAALVRDRVTEHTWLVAEGGASHLVARIEDDLADLADSSANVCRTSMRIDEDPPERFIAAVHRAKAHIEAGDVYQINLSRAWTAYVDRIAPAEVYRRLRAANPAPFAGIARWHDTAIISSSPERLLRVRNGIAESRPIAGTRPRSPQPQADRRLSEELLAHPKERAEHVMLIDLARNDLGRVCRPGSVQVDEFMALESYPHVHHIVSNVRGLLEDNVAPGRVIRAMFPGGTITGCPKLRCMQIIDELEDAPRGAYTGSMGYLNHDGSCEFNILIRTLVQQDGCVNLRTGAGIVADSVAELELEECRAKARGLLLALETT
ncbi:aminodeoxychorismate synthase component I [soil metagenome]